MIGTGNLADRIVARYGHWQLFAAAASAALLVMLGLGSHLWFRADEWAYIVDRSLTVEDLLRPHNEHFVALHVLIYRTMVETLGVGSYLPFQGALLAAHVATAAGILALVRTFLSDAAALAVAVLFLFLGSAADNLVWAFQSGFVAAVGLGVWALVLHRRPWIAAVLLLLGIGSMSGVGLFFVLPLALLGRRWSAVLPAVAVFVLWYVVARPEVQTGEAAFSAYAAYAVAAVGSAFGGILGLNWAIGFPVAAATVGQVAYGVARRRMISPIAAAGILGLASEYTLTTLGRAHLGSEQALAGRYVYAAAPFMLMLIPALPRLRAWMWSCLFLISLVGNILALPRGIALHAALLAYEQKLSIEQRVAPFR